KIGIRNIVMPGQRNVMIVVVMLTAPRMVPRPEMINPKIHRLAPVPGVYSPDNGAYAVQPNPGAPSGIKNADNNIKPPNRYSQYENAFSRGNATSGAPICNGNTILANANRFGVAYNNSMIAPCMVNIWLYCSCERYCIPGTANSPRNSNDSTQPTMKNPNEDARYNNPIFL